MSNRLFFNAREWNFNKACDKNTGERCFINGIDGKLVEVYSIGNWQWDWTEIISKPMMLEKNTEYSFCFWLNGGENDVNTEVCQLRVVFDEDHENCLIYKLNRGYIKPLLRYNGWELYDITFMTGDNEKTELKFAAMAAYMAVQPAKEPEFYSQLTEVLDEFYDKRPQRHNIVFEDGWPTNKWYSTKELRKQQEQGPKGFDPNFGMNFNFGSAPGLHGGSEFWKNFGAQFSKNQSNSGSTDNGAGDYFTRMADDIRRRVRENIMNDIDMDDIIDDITDEIDVDDIMEEIKGQVDIDSLREEIKKEILKHVK